MTPQLKQVIAIAPVSITAGATSSGNIDTLGYDWATIDVIATTSNTPSNKPTVLKLSESDDTVSSNFADVTAFVGGGTGGFTIPSADSSVANGHKFNVDLRARKRYLKVTLSPQTTQVVAAVANLGRGEQAPVSASKAGVLALVEG